MRDEHRKLRLHYFLAAIAPAVETATLKAAKIAAIVGAGAEGLIAVHV